MPDRTPNRSRPQRGPGEHARAILGGLMLLGLLSVVPDLSPATIDKSATQLEHARITAIGAVDPDFGSAQATVVVLDGPRAGTTLQADFEIGPTGLVSPFDVGDEVVVQISTTPDGDQIAVSDRWREPLLLTLLGGFALIVLVVGGLRGIRALIALSLTVGVVVKIVLPLLIGGWPAIPVAIGAATAVTGATLLLTEGPRRSTLAAGLGTVGALLITAVLAALADGAARFSVFQGIEEVAYLRDVVGANIDLAGLLLAAIILGALGVLDDVTITQAATVAELAEADPTMSSRELVRRAMNVGRSHIAATINTLVLAYVAASLPLLLLFAIGRQPASLVASQELVAIEIVRTIVGSIGIVAAVPLTTVIAAWLIKRPQPAGATT